MAYRSEFADAVRRAIGNHSHRQIAPKLNVSPTYVGDMLAGRVPKEALVIALAEVTGYDREELLRAAGYLPPWDPDRAFMDGVRALAEEFSENLTVSAEDLQLAKETPEGVEAALAAVRKRLEERHAR